MINRTRSGMRRVAVVLVVLALAACSVPSSRSLPNPAQGGGGTPGLSSPYPFGTVQQKAPPITQDSVPVIKRITTDKPYVFITIDDGAIQNPDARRLIEESGARPVLFLNQKYVKGHEAYFKAIIESTGAVVGDHTMNHPDLKGKPFEFQRNEICGDADDLQSELGQRPTLFRPPFGIYDANTLKAAATCGIRASVLWSAAVNDGVVQFQGGDRLRPGDIVLMHFRKTFTEDYNAFLAQAKRDGLIPVPLADFLG